MKILREELGAFIKFLHKPSPKELEEATTKILGLITSDLQKTQGATGVIEEFHAFYRAPDDEKSYKTDPLEQIVDRQIGFWTFGIKATLLFITSDDFGYSALKNCKAWLREGVSPDPIETIA